METARSEVVRCTALRTVWTVGRRKFTGRERSYDLCSRNAGFARPADWGSCGGAVANFARIEASQELARRAAPWCTLVRELEARRFASISRRTSLLSSRVGPYTIAALSVLAPEARSLASIGEVPKRS